MRKEEFRSWLEERIQKRPAGDCVSRCKKVETALEVDLDEEFLLDEGKSVMNRLAYSVYDARENKPAPEGINFEEQANIRFGMSDLRSAVKRYFNFCKEFHPEK